MLSPKYIARWQELKAKKRNGRTVAEEMEYQKETEHPFVTDEA